LVKPHITNVYYESILAGGAKNQSDQSHLFLDLFVVGAQQVSGNWTTAYNVTYIGRQILNVTVQFQPPSSYTVSGWTGTTLSAQSRQLSFNSTQKQAIQVALSNSTVKSDVDGIKYYVYSAEPCCNSTVSGYWLQMDQVNGYKSIGILVNTSLTEVLKVVTFIGEPYMQP
jgi:hypothetical protein